MPLIYFVYDHLHTLILKKLLYKFPLLLTTCWGKKVKLPGFERVREFSVHWWELESLTWIWILPTSTMTSAERRPWALPGLPDALWEKQKRLECDTVPQLGPASQTFPHTSKKHPVPVDFYISPFCSLTLVAATFILIWISPRRGKPAFQT